MRVLIVAASGPSHLYPMVPLAWAFRAAGHEVRLAGKARSRDVLLHTGLCTVLAGDPPQLPPQFRDELFDIAYGQPPWPVDWPARTDSLGPDQIRLLELYGRYSVAVADAMADDLIAFARHWRPELIVYETLALSAMIAASLLGVPCVRYTHGTEDVFQTEYRITDGEPLPEFVRMFERCGAEPPAGLPAGLPNYVDTVPPIMFLGAERRRVPMRYVPFNGSGEVPDGLAGPRRRPRVAVTWGVVSPGALGSAAADPYRGVIAAVGDLGVDVVVLATEAQLSSLDAAPNGVRYFAGVPLNLVLPHCDAIVHHGGEGSAMTAACLAVPQMAITGEPHDDQCGGRLAATGAATHLRHQDMSTDSARPGAVADAVGKLLFDNGYAAAAGRLREDIEKMPAPAAVVDTMVS